MRINYWQNLNEGGFYHIYNRAVGNELLFISDNNYRFFLNKWREYIGKYADTYAYCLMPNHFHFLIRVYEMDDTIKKHLLYEKTNAAQHFINGIGEYHHFVSDQFKHFFKSYALSFNSFHKRHGNLFQTRFKRVEIANDVSLLNKICYVHHNPIHHDISPFYTVWQYSSYNAYLSDKPTRLARENGLALFDPANRSKAQFEKYHQWYKENKVYLQKEQA